MKIRAVQVLTSFLLVLSMTLAGPMALADDDDDDSDVSMGALASQIDYTFVDNFDQWDEEGRLLIWTAAIKGDLTGEMKWWFVMPSPVSGSMLLGSRVAFYAARWEIWNGDELLLAGDSAGKTVFPDGADGIWDGHGIVTEAHGKFESLKGRKVYESGPVVVGLDPPFSYTGTGLFLVY